MMPLDESAQRAHATLAARGGKSRWLPSRMR